MHGGRQFNKAQLSDRVHVFITILLHLYMCLRYNLWGVNVRETRPFHQHGKSTFTFKITHSSIQCLPAANRQYELHLLVTDTHINTVTNKQRHICSIVGMSDYQKKSRNKKGRIGNTFKEKQNHEMRQGEITSQEAAVLSNRI